MGVFFGLDALTVAPGTDRTRLLAGGFYHLTNRVDHKPRILPWMKWPQSVSVMCSASRCVASWSYHQGSPEHFGTPYRRSSHSSLRWDGVVLASFQLSAISQNEMAES
jgi:hypothetical protein